MGSVGGVDVKQMVLLARQFLSATLLVHDFLVLVKLEVKITDGETVSGHDGFIAASQRLGLLDDGLNRFKWKVLDGLRD